MPALPTRSPMARAEKDDTFTIPKGRRQRVYRPTHTLPEEPHAVNPRGCLLPTFCMAVPLMHHHLTIGRPDTGSDRRGACPRGSYTIPGVPEPLIGCDVLPLNFH